MAPFTSGEKRKAIRNDSPESPEAGELIPILPPGETSKTKKKTKSGPKVAIDERDERKRENAIIRHAWFKWFTNQANLTPMRKLYWTPGVDEGRKRFESKLVELGTEAFAHLSWDPDAPLFNHYTLDVQTRLRKERARVWQGWFKRPQELTNSKSLSFQYKECEPMSDNKIRWINYNTWLTPMVPRTCLGAGLYVNHPTVQTFNKRHDNLESDGDRINRKLVFVGIGDLGYAQTIQDAAAGKHRYNQTDSNPRPWTAPELTVEKAYTGDDGKQYLTNWTKSTDVFAMGWLIREICDQLMVDPTICMRPIESTKRGVKHPDGPRDIKENKW
ncbi:hypothetical protein R1sor_012834 [Riccia sorocarpa]|uniref:Protein kinase domain-containing protein n=1 Tax=Riccia sorocarpa TaxID=122646 RepID=A0ABD3I4Z6_9MARC